MKIVEVVITAFILSIFVFLVGRILFDKNRKFDLRAVLAVLVYVVLFTFNNFISDFLFTILLYYMSLVLFFEIAFNCNMKEVLIGSLIIYTCKYCILMILEILTVVIGVHICSEGYFVIIHCLAALITVLLIKRTETRIKRFIGLHSRKAYIVMIILIAVNIIFAIVSVINTNHVIIWSFSPESWFILVSIVVINLLTVKLIKEETTKNEIIKSYDQLNEYSKINEKLIEEYRVSLHETKNQLLVIKSKMDGNTKDAAEYIDQLIGSKSMIKYEWLNELSNIPIAGIKGFVNYKVGQMQESGIAVELVISPQLKKMSTSKLDVSDKDEFYKIIGVLLDNAKESAEDSSDKMVSVIAHKDHKLIKILIANTYKGEINLEKINECGYSTKGRGRGIGLKLVNDIIKKNPIYTLETSLIQNFFLQTLTIDINQKSSKKDTLS